MYHFTFEGGGGGVGYLTRSTSIFFHLLSIVYVVSESSITESGFQLDPLKIRIHKIKHLE